MAKQRGKVKKRNFAVTQSSKKSKFKFEVKKPKYRTAKPVFSFTYYDCKDKNNSFKCISDTRKFCKIFENLSGMCKLTWEDITEHHEYHGHDVEWTEKKLPNVVRKLEKNKPVRDYPLYQFKAYDIKSRILGFFNANCVYELVAIDTKHGIYPDKKK